jgi:hypothetical protein
MSDEYALLTCQGCLTPILSDGLAYCPTCARQRRLLPPLKKHPDRRRWSSASRPPRSMRPPGSESGRGAAAGGAPPRRVEDEHGLFGYLRPESRE